MLTFQQLILKLQSYWDAQGCALLQPIDLEVGAGTSHVHTFLRAIGPEPWRAAYVQPSRRPKDGRYGENPNRLQRYYQYQVVMKPSPPNRPVMILRCRWMPTCTPRAPAKNESFWQIRRPPCSDSRSGSTVPGYGAAKATRALPWPLCV